MTAAEVRTAALELVERTAGARGLPATIVDPSALARVAALIHTRPPTGDGAPPVSTPVKLRSGSSDRGGAKAGRR